MTMRSLKTVAAFVACLSLAWGAAAQETITLAPGEHHALALDGPARRVAVADPGVADITTLGTAEVLILGKKPGSTSLTVWPRSGQAQQRFRLQVLPAVPAAGDGSPALQAAGSQVIVDGEMQDAQQHELHRRIAEQAAGDKAVVDRSVIAVSSQVQVDVQIVELNRRVLKEAGINFAKFANGLTVGAFAPGALVSTEFGNGGVSFEQVNPIASAMHLVVGSAKNNWVGVLGVLEQTGQARTLARPSMVVTSGQSASFMVGGEFPIPISQGLGQVTITYKPYGIRLALTPTVFSAQRIALRLAPEVSELDFNNAVTSNGVSVPAVIARRAETSIEVADGESFIIGGLVSRTTAEQVDKVPLLGDIPILGAFFKSMRSTREDRELVIVATPRLVRPIAPRADLPPLPGAELDGFQPSWRPLLYPDARNEESLGLSR